MAKIRLDLELKTSHFILYEMVSKEEWVYEKKFGYLKLSSQGPVASK